MRRWKDSDENNVHRFHLEPIVSRLDQLIRDGVMTDQAELARLGRVTRARLAQVTSLLDLAPDLQGAGSVFAGEGARGGTWPRRSSCG